MLKRSRISLILGLCIALAGVSQAAMLINEDFSGTYNEAYDTTGWTTWALKNRWAGYTDLSEETTRAPNLRYNVNGTMSHFSVTGMTDPRASGVVNNQVFSGTDIVITFQSTMNTWECGAIIFNYQDKGNFYLFGVSTLTDQNNSAAGNSAQFRKVVNSVATTIATFENPEWGSYGSFAGPNPDGVVVSVAVDGADFTFSISRADQTTLTYTASDTTYASGGQAGFIVQAKSNRFAVDKFTVESVPEPATISLLVAGGSLALLHRRKK
jgi:hypothetical protein